MVGQQNRLKGARAFFTMMMYFVCGFISWYASAQPNTINSDTNSNLNTDTDIKSSADSKFVVISPSDDHRSLVNSKLFLSKPDNTITTAQQALRAFNGGEFIENTANRVSFGFTEEVLWAVLPIQADTTRDCGLSSVIEIDNAWLDVVDIFFISGNEIVRQESLGDTEANKGLLFG